MESLLLIPLRICDNGIVKNRPVYLEKEKDDFNPKSPRIYDEKGRIQNPWPVLLEKEKEVVPSLLIPKWPRIYDKGMVINPPVYLEKEGKIEKITWGDPIMEIFEVCVVSGGKKYRKIHGTIRALCYAGILYIFNRSRLNPNMVQRDEPLELTGPICAIPASEKIYIEFDLMEGRTRRNKVINADVGWCPYNDPKDVVFSGIVERRKGSIAISYVVYLDALVATTTVTFKPARSVPGIYGIITAASNMFPDWTSALFHKKRGDPLLLSVSQNEEEVELPLLRSVTAVSISSAPIHDCAPEEDLTAGNIPERPIDGALLINLNLINSHDEEAIANGVLRFPVKNYGDYVSSISSQYGHVQVKVSFVCMDNHLPSPYFYTEYKL